MTTSSIANRRRLVRRLVADGGIESQQDLVAKLQAAGHPVTQATISRDLDAIGAVKARTDSGGHRYEIPGEHPGQGVDRELGRVIDEFVDELATSGNLLVIHTRPGAAHVVGSAFDNIGLKGMLGTVAGDDTLLVIAAEEVGGRGLLEQLAALGVEA
jgi:transcriptional regulator of arginine metabolism